ncbi:MAG: glycerol-3-phosphate 1-O-acyltransferase PlsY [Nitrospiraceae bacterium]
MVNSEWVFPALVVVGYLLGAIPFGVVFAKWSGTSDPRTAGSQNIGFTNVLRVSGKRVGLLTLLGDVGKGWIIGWLAQRSLQQEGLILLAGLSPILGHLYSVFLRFSGGKGVATAFGVVFGIAPAIGLTLLAVWLVCLAVWRYSALSAIVAFGAFPGVSALYGESWLFVGFAVVVGGLVIVRHRRNLARLWAGTEDRVGSRS